MIDLGLEKKDGQEEKILKIIHRHWLNILQQFLPVLFLVLVVMVAVAILPQYLDFSEDENFSRVIIFGANFLAIFIWIYTFFIWIDYFLDYWVITDKKIVNVEQKSLFFRTISELKLEKIQDVTVVVKGFLPTVLDYGDVQVQTAGEVTWFVFRKIPHPYQVKNLIMDLQREVIKEETNELGEVIRKEIHEEAS